MEEKDDILSKLQAAIEKKHVDEVRTLRHQVDSGEEPIQTNRKKQLLNDVDTWITTSAKAKSSNLSKAEREDTLLSESHIEDSRERATKAVQELISDEDATEA